MTKRVGPTGSHARRVLTVSVAQALNAFGSGIAPIAVAFALLGDRDGVAKFSAVLAVGALAPVVMTLAGGVLADLGRSPIRTTQVLRCLAGVVQVLLWVGLLHARSSIVVIGGLLFLGEALSSLTLPSSRRMIAEVVEGEELTKAVATQATLVNLARIASPAVAGVLISVVSAEVAVLVDAATFLLSAALLQAVGKDVGSTGGGGDDPDAGVSARGFRVLLRGSPWLAACAVCGFLAAGAWLSGYQLLGPVLAARSYGGAAGWAMFSTAHVAGLLVGGVATRWVPDSRPLLVSSVCSAAAAVAFLPPGLGLPGAVVVAGFFLAAVALGMAMNLWFVGCVKALPKRFLGRAMAVSSSSELAGGFVLIWACGLLLPHASPALLALACAGVLLLSGIAQVWALSVWPPTPTARTTAEGDPPQAG